MMILPVLLRGQKKRQLEERYPGLDVDSCWILAEGRVPASQTKTRSLIGLGLALVVGGGIMSITAVRTRRRSR